MEETGEQRIRRRPAIFRRQLLVDRKMQVAIISYSIMVAMVTILFMTAFVLVFQSVPQDLEASSSGQIRYYGLLFIMWLCSMGVLTFLGVYITNKTAGPIYRLRKNMQNIASGGAIEDVGFRKDDHFFELADDYNRVLERLRKAETR